MKSVASKMIAVVALGLVFGLCVAHTARTQEAAVTEAGSAASTTISSAEVDGVAQPENGRNVTVTRSFVSSDLDHSSGHPGVNFSADGAVKLTGPDGQVIVQHFDHTPHVLNVWKNKAGVAAVNGELQRAIEQHSAAIRDAANDEQKAAASSELRAALAQHFEEDLKHRQQELDKVAERLEKLRAQLARRREKKDEIVDLQVKVVVNEAEGLGFYRVPSGNDFDQMITPPMVPGRPFKFDMGFEREGPAPARARQ
jgi:hypothetical protein